MDKLYNSVNKIYVSTWRKKNKVYCTNHSQWYPKKSFYLTGCCNSCTRERNIWRSFDPLEIIFYIFLYNMRQFVMSKTVLNMISLVFHIPVKTSKILKLKSPWECLSLAEVNIPAVHQPHDELIHVERYKVYRWSISYQLA